MVLLLLEHFIHAAFQHCVGEVCHAKEGWSNNLSGGVIYDILCLRHTGCTIFQYTASC